MRKAPWLQLPRFQSPAVPESAADELARYRRLRSAPRHTRQRTEQERVYWQRVREWLYSAENRWCRVYLLLLGQRVPATECHHYQGRRGMLLLYEPYWIPVSREGHRWIEDHREAARAMGLLCPLGKYNSPIALTDPTQTGAALLPSLPAPNKRKKF